MRRTDAVVLVPALCDSATALVRVTSTSEAPVWEEEGRLPHNTAGKPSVSTSSGMVEWTRPTSLQHRQSAACIFLRAALFRTTSS